MFTFGQSVAGCPSSDFVTWILSSKYEGQPKQDHNISFFFSCIFEQNEVFRKLGGVFTTVSVWSMRHSIITQIIQGVLSYFNKTFWTSFNIDTFPDSIFQSGITNAANYCAISYWFFNYVFHSISLKGVSNLIWRRNLNENLTAAHSKRNLTNKKNMDFEAGLTNLCSVVSQKSISHSFLLAIAITNALLGSTAVIGNGLVVASYCCTPSLRTPSKILLFALAVTDFLTGLVVHPMVVAAISSLLNPHEARAN